MARAKKYTKDEKEASTIFSSIKSRAEILNWERKDFIDWYLKNNHKCYYCETSLDDLHKFYLLTKKENKRRDQRGKSLEVDRVKPKNNVYEKSNCCLACYWCNNAKTDVFNEEESKIIGKVIRKIISARLINIDNKMRL